MLKLIDLNYFSHNDTSDPAQVISLQYAANGYSAEFNKIAHVEMIRHMDFEGERSFNGVPYSFFKRTNSSWNIPLKTHRYIVEKDPDIVLVQGLIFPLQLLHLKKKLPKKTRIIVQHHAEKPAGIKRYLSKFIDRYVDAYLFTSLGNAAPWIDKGIIASEKCNELPEASSTLQPLQKIAARGYTGISGNENFLWVGQLIQRKDPLTILKAFKTLVRSQPGSRLYMIYQDNTLLEEVHTYCLSDTGLRDSVKLIGKVDHAELPRWYCSADFFISGSHSEGSGYALIEAMSCGCIPIVTNIPSFRKITDNGRLGLLFKPGDHVDLISRLNESNKIDRGKISSAILEHFNKELSFKAIAEKLFGICKMVLQKT